MAHINSAIVVYHPDIAILTKVFTAIASQVKNVLVIANDGAPWSCPLPENAMLAKQDKNLGLGAAYNLAIRWAREDGATHLLLLDQDSVAAPGMVAALSQALSQPLPIAAAGPLWWDRRTGRDGFFVRLSRWGMRKHYPAPDKIEPVDFLISSGSLISLDAFDVVGPFDEGLFIEHIDTDWALRARVKGYKLYGVSAARLEHGFGQATFSLPFLGPRRQFFLYTPDRNYYLLRNSIRLWRKPYTPWQWIFHDIRRTIGLMLFYVLFVPPRFRRLRCMICALRDAFRFGTK